MCIDVPELVLLHRICELLFNTLFACIFDYVHFLQFLPVFSTFFLKKLEEIPFFHSFFHSSRKKPISSGSFQTMAVSQVWCNRFCSNHQRITVWYSSSLSEQCNEENNQLLRDQQKYAFSLFAVQILGFTKKQPELLVNMFVRSYSTLVKKMELCIATWTWWTHFFISTKKESKYMTTSMHMLFSVSPFTVPSNARLNKS